MAGELLVLSASIAVDSLNVPRAPEGSMAMRWGCFPTLSLPYPAIYMAGSYLALVTCCILESRHDNLLGVPHAGEGDTPFALPPIGL